MSAQPTEGGAAQGETPEVPLAPPIGAPAAPAALDGAVAPPAETAAEDAPSASPSATAPPMNPGAQADALGCPETLRARCADAGMSIGEDDARRVLLAWAKPKPLINEQLLSGALTVDDRPLMACKVVRLLETREEKQVYVPASQRRPDLYRYNVGIDAVEVAEPTDFSQTSWRLILEGSE